MSMTNVINRVYCLSIYYCYFIGKEWMGQPRSFFIRHLYTYCSEVMLVIYFYKLAILCTTRIPMNRLLFHPSLGSLPCPIETVSEVLYVGGLCFLVCLLVSRGVHRPKSYGPDRSVELSGWPVYQLYC